MNTDNSFSREHGLLVEYQRLSTSGARAVAAFDTAGVPHLAIPQLAKDIPGSPPYMNGGDSNIEMLMYRWSDGKFIHDGSLPVPGGEDACVFSIGADEYLATASIRTGSGPYDYNCDSILYKRRGADWQPFQSFPTFAAKQWHHWVIGERHFLALAQGVTLDGPVARNARHSCIFEWDGTRFVDFQTLPGGWGYNWAHCEIGGRHLLAYADHTSASLLLAWDSNAFVRVQELAAQGGRAFKFFCLEGHTWLAFANLTGESILYRWQADSFLPHQSLGGPGAREFALVQTVGTTLLIKINFILGTPAAPKTDLISNIYAWQRGAFVVVAEFPTFGATDAAAFTADDRLYLAVSNSLSREIRFREDTVIYRLNV